MLQGLNAVCAIVGLLCYFYVVYQMFENAESVIGIICLVGMCVLGLGGLVAFVYGWIKARDWEIVPVMAIWSVVIVLNITISVAQALLEGA